MADLAQGSLRQSVAGSVAEVQRLERPLQDDSKSQDQPQLPHWEGAAHLCSKKPLQGDAKALRAHRWKGECSKMRVQGDSEKQRAGLRAHHWKGECSKTPLQGDSEKQRAAVQVTWCSKVGGCVEGWRAPGALKEERPDLVLKE